MTEIPAPPPNIPSEYQNERGFTKFWKSNVPPLVVGGLALFMSVYVLVGNAENTRGIANEAKSRAELNEAINSKLQAGLCGLLVDIGNPSTLPATNVGKENTLKYRRSAEIFECPGRNYIIPPEKLKTAP